MKEHIIEALKLNEKPFTLMSTQMRTTAEAIGRKGNFECLTSDGEWGKCTQDVGFYKERAYRLRPDYAPEPEIVECDLKMRDGIWKWLHPTNGWTKLHLALDITGFKFWNGEVFPGPVAYANKDNDSCGLILAVDMKGIKSGQYKAVHATHVLFSK